MLRNYKEPKTREKSYQLCREIYRIPFDQLIGRRTAKRRFHFHLDLKSLGFLILLLAAWLPLAHSEEISCHKEEEIREGGKQIVDLKLISDQHRVVGLAFNKIESFADQGNPMAVWTCSIDTTHLDKDHRIKWSRKGNRTAFEISENDTRDTSKVRIEKMEKGYKVFFEEMSRYYSGMTQFPVSVFIGKGNRECAVTSR